MPQVNPVVQIASPRVPWHDGCPSHTGEKVPKVGQSSATWQQSPNAQQKPFWQWPLVQSEPSSQAWPLARSARHTDASQWAADLNNEANKRFVADFSKTYGRAPTMYASQAYDVGRLLDSAVRAVNGKIEDREAFRIAIKKANFQSVRGSFRFNRNQFPIQDIYARVVIKDENGEIRNKLVGTIVKDNEDVFVNECPMK